MKVWLARRNSGVWIALTSMYDDPPPFSLPALALGRVGTGFGLGRPEGEGLQRK